MNYKSKTASKKVQAKIARRKRNRYHNDAAFFPDDNLDVDRKRRKALKKRAAQKTQPSTNQP